MKSDSELLTDVQAELEWDPSFDSRGMVAAVKNGAVTLAGFARSYSDKWTAEHTVKKVAGVRAVANEIVVKLDGDERSDKDIASAALNALESNVSVPETVKITVSDGWITLEGSVEFWFEKNAAEQAVRNLWGIKGVRNSLDMRPPITATDVKSEIQNAFQRHAALDANKISVKVTDSTVTLTGVVDSWAERSDAETAAWAARGVTRVNNQLAVHV
jgi:osmotically-inducible protein OsmY